MKIACFLLILIPVSGLSSQQVPDLSYHFPVDNPRYEQARGSIVMIDAGHHNFHTMEGRYAPFAKVLRQDGYQVISNPSAFNPGVLKTCRILVISNPLDSSNLNDWRLPIPSAFPPSEIQTIHDWVKNGGRLLLIADHMPFSGAADDLAKSFGFDYWNGFAMDNRRRNTERFLKKNHTLLDNEITDGIDTVVTFTGSAFRKPGRAKAILALKDYTLLAPRVAWQFEENTPKIDSKGYCQGAYMPYGKGRIVVMGEAAMFTAQLTGTNQVPVGINHPDARQNALLLLNIMHWLDQN